MNNAWILGLYTSGGSAHERAMEDLCRRNPHILQVNVLNSNCTFFPGLGRFCAWAWNTAQQKGDVKLQVLLGNLQKLAEKIFYLPTYYTVLKILQSKEGHLPERVVATSPIFLAAICRAVVEANKMANGRSIASVDLYMIEPPTDDALYYFDTIKGLPSDHRRLIRLYAQHPIQEDIEKSSSEEQYWLNKAGLTFDQIVFDPPVKEVFKQADALLPRPGDPLALQLKGYSDPFFIRAEDRVGLIMLGGIPTCEAILHYIDAAITLAENERIACHPGRNYLFVGCGKETLGLYDRVHAYLDSRPSPAHLKIVPFLNQPVEQIFGRSDFSITRTGGMTSLEILELKRRRGDDKLILLHAQLKDSEFEEGSDQETHQEYLITKGIPLWEGGNARYLRKALPGVSVVTPKSCSVYMIKKFYPYSTASMSLRDYGEELPSCMNRGFC